jgi:urease accessory protein
MMILVERDHGQGPVSDKLILPFEHRQKSRLRVHLDSGADAAVMLERGGVLRGGDRLRAQDGRVVAVEAALENIMRVTAADARQLAQAAYHLGNRHVPLQVGDGWLLLEYDHVLEHMLEHLGVRVAREVGPFEPEAGAYGQGQSHGHGHHHGHSHGGHHHHDH